MPRNPLENNQNNHCDEKIYFCERTRNISQVRTFESQICNESVYVNTYKPQSCSIILSETFQGDNTPCLSTASLPESHRQDVNKTAGFEVDISVSTTSEQLKLGIHNHVKNIPRDEFEVELDCHANNPGIILITSSFDDMDKIIEPKLPEPQDVRHVKKCPPNFLFQREFSNVSLVNVFGPLEIDCGDRKNCEFNLDNFKFLTNFTEYIKEMIIDKLLPKQETEILCAKSNSGISIQTYFECVGNHQDEKIDPVNSCMNSQIIEIFSESCESSSKDLYFHDNKESHTTEPINTRDSQETEKHTYKSDTTNYDTCSSQLLNGEKLHRASTNTNKVNDYIVNSFDYDQPCGNMNACPRVNINYFDLNEDTNKYNLSIDDPDADSSMDFYSLASNDIIIPVPILNLKFMTKTVENSLECNSKIINVESYPNFDLTKIDQEILRQKHVIDDLLQILINTAIAKSESYSHNGENFHSVGFNEMVDKTWTKIKALSSYAYQFGFAIADNTSNAVTQGFVRLRQCAFNSRHL